MEITISHERVIRVTALLFLLGVLVAAGFWLKSNSLLDRWFAFGRPSPTPDAEVPAMQAVRTFYSPNLGIGQEKWEEQVCTNMTAAGCQMFRQLYAPTIWDAAQSRKIPSNTSITFISIAENMKDGSQVWKLQITTQATSAVIYIQAEKDPTTKEWLLERVMFSQEAQTRYGK